MIGAVATVLGDVAVERKRGTVHLRVHTDLGIVALRFTPATAQVAGTRLRLAAVQPAGEREQGAGSREQEGAPIQKPGGGIL